MNGGSTHDEPDEAWLRAADRREAGQPRVGPYPVPGLLRRARRLADLSQRELARRARVSHSTVGRMESGAIVPVLPSFQRMLAAAGLWLVVVDDDGHVVQPMRDIDDTRNGGDWHYPAHLDTILDPRPGEWWGDRYGLARPPETFHRDRKRRDSQRHWSTRSRETWSSYSLGGMSPLDEPAGAAKTGWSDAVPLDGEVPDDAWAGDVAAGAPRDGTTGAPPDGVLPGPRSASDTPPGAGPLPDPAPLGPDGVRDRPPREAEPFGLDGVRDRPPREAEPFGLDGVRDRPPREAEPFGPDGLRDRPPREWPIGFRRKRKRPARP